MSEIYFLGTTKPLAHTEYKFKDIIPDMDSDGMLHNDGIRFEENLWPDAVATGVRKILKGCHIYAVQATLGLDYEGALQAGLRPADRCRYDKNIELAQRFYDRANQQGQQSLPDKVVAGQGDFAQRGEEGGDSDKRLVYLW